MELDWLETFLAVVDRGGFTAASSQVHRSQSRVSAHIAALESAAVLASRKGILNTAAFGFAYLARTEGMGAWDDALLHAERAVAINVESDFGFMQSAVIGIAVLVPAGRGDWATAEAYLASMTGNDVGYERSVVAFSMSRARVAESRGDAAGVLAALDPVRDFPHRRRSRWHCRRPTPCRCHSNGPGSNWPRADSCAGPANAGAPPTCSTRHRFAALGAVPYAERCAAELAAYGLAPATRIGRDRFGLTSQELVVARLAAKGRSNREIADELVVSIKTIEYHLRNAFAKLKVNSRRQLPDRLAERPDGHA